MSLSVLFMDFAIFYHVFLLNVFLIGTTIWNTFPGGYPDPLTGPTVIWRRCQTQGLDDTVPRCGAQELFNLEPRWLT